jgi:rhodanese-related sulfurtransferase/DNA-binding transcriptional ArsR family regulator
VSQRSRKLKDAVFEQFARIGKAMSSPRRLELIDLLAQAPRTVEALARETGMSVANASQHLQVLRSAGLAEANKEGLYVTYQLAGEEVTELYLSLRRLGEARIAEVERIRREYFSQRDGMEPVDSTELIARARRGEVVVLDVRPDEEYRAGHIPGALSVPVADLERRVSELPGGKTIVAYCRGPYCVFAIEAVEFLRGRGFHAVRLQDGMPEWRARRLPVEVSP